MARERGDSVFVSPVATTNLSPDNVALTDFADDVYARAFLGMNRKEIGNIKLLRLNNKFH